MNKQLADPAVQAYITANLHADVHQLAMGKSPFPGISAQELANQIAAKRKAAKKLPTWFNTPGICYPALLSVEQCSSETTADYKARLASGSSLIDLTGGFGVDSFYFGKTMDQVIHCEINAELSSIARYNAKRLPESNVSFINQDGLAVLEEDDAQHYDTIYIDPARRSSAGKVFMLRDCTPDVVSNLPLLLNHCLRLLIKTAPLLDLTAGLKELEQVAAIHIISVKNECKELIWVLEKGFSGITEIVCVTLNEKTKTFRFELGEESACRENRPVADPAALRQGAVQLGKGSFLYEPDVSLLKSGAFHLIARRYQLQKIHSLTQLYAAPVIREEFPGRIFRIDEIRSAASLKKEKNLQGNVIVRNYPDQAAALVKKYRIIPDKEKFLIFCQADGLGKVVIACTILQHY